jgi:hypothetical protein
MFPTPQAVWETSFSDTLCRQKMGWMSFGSEGWSQWMPARHLSHDDCFENSTTHSHDFGQRKKQEAVAMSPKELSFFTNRHDFQMSVWLWLWSNSSLVRNIGFNGFDLSSKIWVGRKKHTLSYLQEKYDTEVKLTCNNMQCDLCNTIMIQHENMPYLNKKLRRVNFQNLIGLVSLQHVPGFTDPRFTQPFANASCLHVISNG